MRLLLLLISLALTAQTVYTAPIASVDLEYPNARDSELPHAAKTGGIQGPKLHIRSWRHAIKSTGKLAETAFSNGKGGLQQHAKSYVATSYNNHVKGGSRPQSHTQGRPVHRQDSIRNPFNRRLDDDGADSVNVERGEGGSADDESLHTRSWRHAIKSTGKLAETAFSNGKGGLQQHAKNYAATTYNNHVKGGIRPQSHTQGHTVHRQDSIRNPFHRRIDDDEADSVNMERGEGAFADDESLETRTWKTAAERTGKLALSNGLSQHTVKKYTQSFRGGGRGSGGHGTATTSKTVQGGQSGHHQNDIHNPFTRRGDYDMAPRSVEHTSDPVDSAVLVSRSGPSDKNKGWCSTCSGQTTRQQTKSLFKVGAKHGVDSVKTWAKTKNSSGGHATGPHHPNVANPFT